MRRDYIWLLVGIAVGYWLVPIVLGMVGGRRQAESAG